MDRRGFLKGVATVAVGAVAARLGFKRRLVCGVGRGSWGILDNQSMRVELSSIDALCSSHWQVW